LIETYDKQFPTGILNEARSLWAHLSKYYIASSDADKEHNLLKAEEHLKRTILDCYKYLCISLDDRRAEFEKKYKNLDLSLVDQGEFLRNFIQKKEDAKNLILKARNLDLTLKHKENVTNEDVYGKYKMAYEAHAELDKFIFEDSFGKIEYVWKRALIKDIFTKIFAVIGLISSVITIYTWLFR
jgi:hypothetical protein